MPTILGVIGARNSLTKQILQNEILNPILDDLGKIDKILLPEEHLTSAYIEAWAIKKDIDYDFIKSDWLNYGKKASILRDGQVEKQSTALLVFEGPRSRFYLDFAERIAKKRSDCKVYVVEAKTVEPVLLDIQNTRQITEKEEADILTIPKMFATANGVSSAKKCLISDE
jgi:hypothetical protein